MKEVNYKELLIGLTAIGQQFFNDDDKETSQKISDLIGLIYKYAILNKANFGEINVSHILDNLNIIENEAEETNDKTLKSDFENLRDLDDKIFKFAIGNTDFILRNKERGN